MEFSFLSPARSELEEAIAYYNQQRDGLGDEFAAEVYRTIGRVQLHPHAWAKLSRRTRRCRTKRFPYGVIYQIRPEGILIVAISHLLRKPTHWQDRVARL